MRYGRALAGLLLFLGTVSPVCASAASVAVARPAKNEPDVWLLVQKVGTADAYLLYTSRFPFGPHFQNARAAYLKSIGITPSERVPAPPPPPIPMVPRLPAIPLARDEVDRCIKLLVDQQIGLRTTDEAKAVLAAQRSNLVTDYQAYLAKYPTGACRDLANEKIKARANRRFLFRPIKGLGPLAAQRTRELGLTADDYPAAALSKGEQGRVVAEWDVSEDGVAERCRTVQSSGSESLDDDTCRLLVSRLRYDPARDANGIPVRSVDHLTINWTLPEEPPAPAEAAH